MTKNGPKTTVKPTAKPTSVKLHNIRQALPQEASAARVQLDRIILEVEMLEDYRAALHNIMREDRCIDHPQHKPPSEVVTQSIIDF